MKKSDKLAYESLRSIEDRTSVNFDKMYYYADSKIHGKGVFASMGYGKDDVIGSGVKIKNYPIRQSTDYDITELGSKINHQRKGNVVIKENKKKDWDIVAGREINKNEELTTDYKQAPYFVNKNTEGFVEY